MGVFLKVTTCIKALSCTAEGVHERTHASLNIAAQIVS